MHLKAKDMIPKSDPRVCLIGHPAPAWLVNYADLMTELVCFFIILYALSASLNKDVQQAKKEVEETMKQEQVAGDVKVDKDGMHITITEQGENVFFQSGSADLSPRMVEILDKLVPSLMKLAKDGHDIIVEGHTDNIPIHNPRFNSNWELSTERATNVVLQMIHANGFPPARMGAIGYGEYRPIAANDTAEHQSANRRVVFFVKNKQATPADGKKKAKKPDEEKAAEVPAETAPADAQAPPEDAAPAEPTTDNALPLPREAPAE